ncbi:pyridoxal phosphate-dependent aminotransferase [Balneatrix alpica]|uniref:Aminotransferase n=1 Tax=Balneatrix alpica TaxID=75684 RepID=A0ABV5ZCP3_9GAMM|nr:pyridoxal phosphate-dependent aminotransferase [Balneatrix alpica]
MAVTLSQRLQHIHTSPTALLTKEVKALIAAGEDIIALAAGEPDFATPEHIQTAAIEAMRSGQTGYTPVAGTPELLAAIAAKYRRDFSLHYDNEQIIATCGGKQAIYSAFLAILSAGDEVLIPAPYWVSYPDMARCADAIPVIVECDEGEHFKLSATKLRQHLNQQTKLLILNSPNNPSGQVYSRQELAELATVIRQWPELWILCDDIYEPFCWHPDGFHTLIEIAPDLADRTLIVNGVSKAYAMTGWRLGYALGPASLIKALGTLQSQSTSCACSISQAAAVAALQGPQDCITLFCQSYQTRHAWLLEQLNNLPGVSCLPSQGAFYLFANVREAMDQHQLTTDVAFCQWLLQQAKVAVVPGSAFGLTGYVRFSFAAAQSDLEKAIERLQKIL